MTGGGWLGGVLLAVIMALAAAQADDLSALDLRFRSLLSQGNYTEAATVGERVLKITEQARGLNDLVAAAALNNLAIVYQAQGRYAAALEAYGRALTIREKAEGREHLDVAETLNNLAIVYQAQGRYAAALEACGRALAIEEKALGLEHPYVAATLSNIAEVYNAQDRYEEALNAHRRALAIREKALGPNHPDVAGSLLGLGLAYHGQGRYEEALEAYGRALAIQEKALGPEHPYVANSLLSLGNMHFTQGRYAAALEAYGRALTIQEKALGPEHADVAGSLLGLGLVYQAQGRYAAALEAYGRALAIEEKALGLEHPDVATTLNNLAVLGIAQRDWAQAQDHWQRATQILEHRTSLGAAGLGQPLAAKGRSEAARLGGYFQGLVKVAWRRAGEGRAEIAGAMFVKAQWAAASEAAEALTEMAVRGAKDDPKLAALVRERQDLLAEWQKRDQARTEAASTPPDNRNKEAEAVNVARISAIEARIGEIDKTLKGQFPDYAALASVAVTSIADVQAVLHDDEALLMFLDTDDRFKPLPEQTFIWFKPLPEETFVWVVTKREVRWLRSDLGTQALAREVGALRCGLDATAWWSKDTVCAGLTGASYMEADYEAGVPLPFDLGRAHAVYKSLLGDAEDLIKGKHLLIVPAGALTTLPFQVLVTKPPASQDLASATWLVRDHAITVLPSVASLSALRRTAKPSAATRPMIGFGNPLLDGDQSHPQAGAYYKELADKARSQISCAATPAQRTASLRALSRSATPVARTAGLADLAHLKLQTPLPETADELCAVARSLGADPGEIRIAKRATETEIKRLSKTSELAHYRIVHFATHGLLAGQLRGTREPGLILTPPAIATAEDDGYLSGSEIAALKLDAEWVILSACNTAGGAGQGETAEALSGLARVFFYAGARALLVSHWEVDSAAAVKLITTAIGALANDKSLGRAEALRRAMLSVMADTSRPPNWVPASHPSVWAPFVVVGEGGAGV